MDRSLLYLFIAIPFILTLINIISFIIFHINKKNKLFFKIIELVTILAGIFYIDVYLDIQEILFVNWDVQLYNSENHSIISPSSLPTLIVIASIAFLGYLAVRFIPVKRQAPLISSTGIAAMYLGAALCVVWCIQTAWDVFLLLLPLNCILIFVKTIYIFVYEKNKLLESGETSTKYKKLAGFLGKAINLPLIGLFLAIPLLGIIILILMLFGQEPNSIIKAWTDTADWTLSQKIAPQNIMRDEHYLCTVAAGGHRKVVKPLRTGIRHGHRVVVNRQLCVANAFEQVLEEKTPRFHRIIRKIYDSTGYPIAKHIHSKTAADIVYFVMKPLEWLFLLVLYSVDVNPENRIAVQYPHAPLPQ